MVYFYHGTAAVALNIKNSQVDLLAAEVAGLAGETKTEAIRKALQERRARLLRRLPIERRRQRLLDFLEREIWPRIPAGQLGRAPDRAERERILGYGREGV